MATIKVTDENFDQIVLKSDKPFVQRFTAEWCGPCKKLAPTMEVLAEEYKELITVTKLDVDISQDVSAEYFVKNIPAILIFKNGKVFEKIIGMSSISEYKSMINRALED